MKRVGIRVTPTGKIGTDFYSINPITQGYLEASIRASTWQDSKKGIGGHNGAAIESRIAYMRNALQVCMVDPVCVNRALETIRSLEGQLEVG